MEGPLCSENDIMPFPQEPRPKENEEFFSPLCTPQAKSSKGESKKRGRPCSKPNPKTNTPKVTLKSFWAADKRKREAEEDLVHLNPTKKNNFGNLEPQTQEISSESELDSRSEREDPIDLNDTDDISSNAESQDANEETGTNTSEYLLKRLIEEVRAMRRENKKLKAEIRKDRESTKKEIQHIMKKLNKREDEWRDVKDRLVALENKSDNAKLANSTKQLEARVNLLEKNLKETSGSKYEVPAPSHLKTFVSRLEAQDRACRKNNIVIRGLDVSGGSIREIVERFLYSKFGTKNAVLDANFIKGSRKLIVAKITNWDTKMGIMRKKKEVLGATEIYVNDDLTREERVVAKKLRDLARSEREKGKEVKYGHQKIAVDGKWSVWNSKKGTIEPIRTRGPLTQTVLAQVHHDEAERRPNHTQVNSRGPKQLQRRDTPHEKKNERKS